MSKKGEDLIKMESDIIQSLIKMENIVLARKLKILTRRDLQQLRKGR